MPALGLSEAEARDIVACDGRKPTSSVTADNAPAAPALDAVALVVPVVVIVAVGRAVPTQSGTPVASAAPMAMVMMPTSPATCETITPAAAACKAIASAGSASCDAAALASTATRDGARTAAASADVTSATASCTRATPGTSAAASPAASALLSVGNGGERSGSQHQERAGNQSRNFLHDVILHDVLQQTVLLANDLHRCRFHVFFFVFLCAVAFRCRPRAGTQRPAIKSPFPLRARGSMRNESKCRPLPQTGATRSPHWRPTNVTRQNDLATSRCARKPERNTGDRRETRDVLLQHVHVVRRCLLCGEHGHAPVHTCLLRLRRHLRRDGQNFGAQNRSKRGDAAGDARDLRSCM
jgi:hypothetical protein